MKKIINALLANKNVSDYKLNIHHKESYELFFVKGKLETVRRTDTCDKEVTVYVDHDGYKGDAQFFVYPSTTEEQLHQCIDEAINQAILIQNPHYELPDGEEGQYDLPSNFAEFSPSDLAATIAKCVFEANSVKDASLNSVEIFVNKHTLTVINNRGLKKTQIRYDAMLETIPTYNGQKESVELYQQYNFCNMSQEELTREVSQKIREVQLRYEAIKPQQPLQCPVILNKHELVQLFGSFAMDLNYASVYSRANLFKIGDQIQSQPTGDKITITMAGAVPGNVRSSAFDSDGLTLNSIRLVKDGVVENYYGANRYGQYLNIPPTGTLPCLLVETGSASDSDWQADPYIEVLSMSGLQVDLNSDYIGGEIRLALYHDGESTYSITGISMSGSLNEVLRTIRLSEKTGVFNGYVGPEKAILSGMKIF